MTSSDEPATCALKSWPASWYGAAHHVGDDDADLAADAVIAVGHRRHEPLVLADDELLVLVLGERREDAGLGRSPGS